jgi:hypothetical protein
MYVLGAPKQGRARTAPVRRRRRKSAETRRLIALRPAMDGVSLHPYRRAAIAGAVSFLSH